MSARLWSNGVYDDFVFTGTMKNLSTIEAIGSDRLGDTLRHCCGGRPGFGILD